MNDMIKLTITSNEADQRLDRFLKKYMKRASLSAIYKMIRKDIKVNGKRAKEDTQLKEGDELALYMTEEKLAELTAPIKKKAAKRQFKIAYEDENVLIVDKPKGLLTHGDAHEKKNTLVNQECGYLQEKGEYDPAKEKTFVPSPHTTPSSALESICFVSRSFRNGTTSRTVNSIVFAVA